MTTEIKRSQRLHAMRLKKGMDTLELRYPEFTVKLSNNEQVKAVQKGTGANSYIELRVWKRNRGQWNPTQLVSNVPCGELAVMWDRMTSELNQRMEYAVGLLKQANDIENGGDNSV